MKADSMTDRIFYNHICLMRPLSLQEERALASEAEKGNQEARRILIERNMRTVFFVATQYRGPEVCMEDLVSVGCIGLVKAVDSYDPARNIKISTYASKCVENEILMYFRKDGKNKTVSLERTYEGDGMGEYSLMDTLSTEEDIVWDEVEKRDAGDALRQAVSTLSSLDAEVMSRRFGLFGEGEETQSEIAGKLGVTQSYVSRIEKKAIQKIKDKLINR